MSKVEETKPEEKKEEPKTEEIKPEKEEKKVKGKRKVVVFHSKDAPVGKKKGRGRPRKDGSQPKPQTSSTPTQRPDEGGSNYVLYIIIGGVVIAIVYFVYTKYLKSTTTTQKDAPSTEATETPISDVFSGSGIQFT